jgi:uncharacterized membrane protein YvbJ
VPICSSCSKEVQAGAIFCPNCGSRVNSPEQPALTSPVPVDSAQLKGSLEHSLETAIKRIEIVSYIMAGAAVILLAVAILLLF